MKVKENLIENWSQNMELFLHSKDSKEHRESIGEILKEIGSKRRFNQTLKSENTDLSHMLSIFEAIPKKNCKSKEECECLRKIGKEARELSAKKKYKQIVALGYDLSMSNIISFLKLDSGEYDDMVMEDFYKEHLPSGIFTQFFLLEMMAINSDYDWNRDDEIVRQSLVLAGMCFFDIYECIHEMEEVLDFKDDEPYQMSEKDELYYDAMEYLNCGEPKRALGCMKKALKIDPDYIQTYVGLEAAYREIGDFDNQKKYADLGFELTKKKFPKWPSRMEWGVMENRAYMRSICDKATTSQISGDTKTAEELYRLLLKMNPNDNQGIRYLLAGMFEGLTPDDVDRMTDEGNENQDWSAQENTVIRQNKIHKFWKEPKFQC